MRSGTGNCIGYGIGRAKIQAGQNRKVQKIIVENPSVDFLGGPFNNQPLKIFFKKINYFYKAKVKDICIKNFPQPSTVIFRKEIMTTETPALPFALFVHLKEL